MKKFIIFWAIACLMATLSGCKKESMLPYIGGDAVSFWRRTVVRSLYEASVAELPKDTIKLDLHILGFTKPYDRTVTGAAIEDAPGTPDNQRVTTATPGEYRILGGTIPANSLTGKFEVEIINQDKLATEELKLALAITENEHFIPGLKENYTITLTWTQKLMQPTSWNTMAINFCSIYSSQCYRIIIMITGHKEIVSTAGPDPLNNPDDRPVPDNTRIVWGIMFGNYIRDYNAAHPDAPMLHDDGAYAGTPIIPRY